MPDEADAKFRCVRRYESTLPYALGAKRKSTRNINFTIRKLKKSIRKLNKLWEYVGENVTTVNFTLSTTIKGELSGAKASMNIKGVPTKKPCIATARFEIFNNSFPQPAHEYFIFGVQAGNSPSYYIGDYEGVSKRTPCSFDGGGLDCTSRVTYRKLAGPYTTFAKAQKGFCDHVNRHEYWQFSSCKHRYLWHGIDWYWGCESSVQTALSKYCSAKF